MSRLPRINIDEVMAEVKRLKAKPRNHALAVLPKEVMTVIEAARTGRNPVSYKDIAELCTRLGYPIGMSTVRVHWLRRQKGQE